MVAVGMEVMMVCILGLGRRILFVGLEILEGLFPRREEQSSCDLIDVDCRMPSSDEEHVCYLVIVCLCLSLKVCLLHEMIKSDVRMEWEISS